MKSEFIRVGGRIYTLDRKVWDSYQECHWYYTRELDEPFCDLCDDIEENVQNEIKQFCMTKSGWVLLTKGKNVFTKNGQWFIEFEQYNNNCFSRHREPVVKFADTFEELIKKEETPNANR